MDTLSYDRIQLSVKATEDRIEALLRERNLRTKPGPAPTAPVHPPDGPRRWSIASFVGRLALAKR